MLYSAAAFILLLLAYGATSQTAEQRLLKNLFLNYNPVVRPVEKPGDSVPVNISLAILSLRNTASDELEINAWLRIYWLDSLLKWDPEQYENITDVRIPESMLWLPDITVYFSSRNPEQNKVSAVLYNTGEMLLVRPMRLWSFCKPMPNKAQQYCQMRIGSWVYSSDMLNINLEGKGFDLNDYFPSRDWPRPVVEADRVEFKYKCCAETYPFLRYTFRQRQALQQQQQLEEERLQQEQVEEERDSLRDRDPDATSRPHFARRKFSQ